MHLKVVGNEKEGGQKGAKRSQYVSDRGDRCSFNFAVVFDCMYFRFRPSKAKSIGNVLTNRQNAANCCLHRGLNKYVKELRMGIPALRQYIDATMPLAPIDNGVQICSVYNFQVLFRGFFSVRRVSPNYAGGFCASIGSARYKIEKQYAPSCRVLPINGDIAY